MAGADILSGLADRIRGIAGAGSAIAREAAPGVLAAAKATAAAGTTPDGVPWAPRKSDGGRALAKAADAITVSTAEDVVFLEIHDHHVEHNFKRGPGYEPRRILPDVKAGEALPKSYVAAIRAAAGRVLGKVVT